MPRPGKAFQAKPVLRDDICFYFLHVLHLLRKGVIIFLIIPNDCENYLELFVS